MNSYKNLSRTFSITLFIILQLFKATTSHVLEQFQRCYNINHDLRRRSFDFSKHDPDVISCLTLGLPFKMFQWLPAKQCLRSKSMKKPISNEQVLTLVRVGYQACSGNMSSPRQGRIKTRCKKLIGTYKKEECRDLCYMIKACRAATYTDGDQTCRVCVQPLPSYQTDNVRGHTSYVRLPLVTCPSYQTDDIRGHTSYFRLHMDHPETSLSKSEAWFRKNDVFSGKSGVEPDHLKYKLAPLFICALRCLQDRNCAGFSITSIESLQCALKAGGDAMYLRVTTP